MEIRQFVDEGLGNSTHLVISRREGVAALIDPLRDVDRYLEVASEAGIRISHVLETHVHNDFVSGSRELAARVGAEICASAAACLQFPHRGLADGDVVTIGDVHITVLATPGHTPEHVSYLAEDQGSTSDQAILFSGGSLLVGAVARTDLLGHEHAVGLAYQLYHSLHDKILRLADDVLVYPTHGAGSFCAATPGTARHTTIGGERRTNAFVRAASVEQFVALARDVPSYPTYYRNMASINRSGPRLLGALPDPPPLQPGAVRERQIRGEALLDLRSVARWAEGHVPGAYHVELRPAFGSWVGWVVPFGSPIVLVTDTPGVPQDAVRQLVRIGYDDLPGYLAGGMTGWERAGLPVARTPVLTIEEVRARMARGEPLVALDVRQDTEWFGGHVRGAEHVEAGALAGGGWHLPRDRTLAVYCGHGQRAATALSLLERAGYDTGALVRDGMEAWQAAGYPVDTPVGGR